MPGVVRPLLVSLTLAAAQAAPVPGPAADLASARFLVGCWRLERPGAGAAARVVDEQWMAPGGDLMLGMSRTVAGGRATEFEFTRIAVRDGRLVYVALPSGQAGAEFPAVRVAPGELVFENAQHDFPQRIQYRSRAADRLEARIEGTVRGTLRGVDFPYVRVACE